MQLISHLNLLFCLLAIPILSASIDRDDVRIGSLFQYIAGKKQSFPRLIVGKDATLFYANVSIGTPPQLQHLHIDTVQPYIWLTSGVNSTKCNRIGSNCHNSSEFYAKASNSSRVLYNNNLQNVSIVDGEKIVGHAYSDVLRFPNMSYGNDQQISINKTVNSTLNATLQTTNLSVSNQSFYVADQYASNQVGALGLGAGRISDGNGVTSVFDAFSILNVLYSAGVIASPSYSLWLGNGSHFSDDNKFPSTELNDYYGEVLFGAVDSSFIDGKFIAYDMIPYADIDDKFTTSGYPIVPLGPIYIISNTGKTLNMTTKEYCEPVLLDAQYSLSRLPASFIVQVAIQLEAMYVGSLDRWVVPCSLVEHDVNFNFYIGDLPITIPLEDFLIPVGNVSTNKFLHFSENEDACYLAMYPNTDIGYNILGFAFLKNIHLAVDFNASVVAVGQANRKLPESMQSLESVGPASYQGKRVLPTSSSSVKAITNGIIPFATTDNSTKYSTLTMRPSKIGSAIPIFPNDLWGIVNSDGLITVGKSFYKNMKVTTVYEAHTANSSASSKRFITTTSTFSPSKSNSTATSTAGAHSLRPLGYQAVPQEKTWRSVGCLLFSIFTLLFIL